MVFFNSKSYALPTVVSVFLHAVVLFFVIGGWRETQSRTPVPVPNFIPAKLVQLEQSAPKAQAKQQPKTVDLTAQRAEDDRRNREAEQKRQAEAQRKQQAEKAKQEQEQREKERTEAERARREKERQQQLAKELTEAIAEEEALLQSEEDQELAQSYKSFIHDRIQQNWNRPFSSRNGMFCDLTINFVPTGRVVGVTLTKGSGNTALDRSCEQAVWKTEVIPELKQIPSAAFERNFRTVLIRLNVTNSRL